MSRPPRIEFAGALHHAMARGDRREEIFRDDRDRSKFLGYCRVVPHAQQQFGRPDDSTNQGEGRSNSGGPKESSMS